MEIKMDKEIKKVYDALVKFDTVDHATTVPCGVQHKKDREKYLIKNKKFKLRRVK
jgi:hypothetical protein